MARPRPLSPVAYLLLGATVFLVLSGLLMIYSASSVVDYVKYEDSAYHVKKQVAFALAGLLALAIASRWDFTRRAGRSSALTSPDNVAWALWGVALLGLIAVEIGGVEKWGATRSFDLGPVYVQPSEYAKLGTLLVVAIALVKWRRQEVDGRGLLHRLGIAVVPVVGLILLQPDMGTTMSLLFAVTALLWLGGIRARWFALIAGLGIPAAYGLIRVAGYRMERLTAFLDPWADPADSGYQIIQSLYAFGSGGLTGAGLGMSRQKFFYLPAAHTDFIFAVIGEELGWIGSIAVVAAFAIFAYAGFRVALECKDLFGRLLAGGLTAMITIQALMNMAAVTGLMPITGIPLPFVSAGGSSLTLTLACVGLILSVARASGAASAAAGRPPSTTGRSRSAGSVERRRDGRPHLSGIDGGRAAGRRRA